MGGPRYALYFMPPPETPLARFGASAIGYDAWNGQPVPYLPLARYSSPAAAADLAGEPARYGFHATLKAPFQLREGATEADLEAMVEDFTAHRAPVPIGMLEVRALSRFLALVPNERCEALNTLAADCVTGFEPLRAPLSEGDRARRLKSPLSERQLRYLDAYGYPHVLEEFRFHMTLTGPLSPDTQEALQGELQALWAPLSHPVTIAGLAIAMQPTRTAQFRVHAYYPLAGP